MVEVGNIIRNLVPNEAVIIDKITKLGMKYSLSFKGINTEIQNRKRDYDKQADEALIRAYNIVIKHSAKNGLESYELKNYAADFSSQIRVNLLKEISDEEWIISAVGRNLLDKINMLPSVDHPIQVKELYEAFLRFDDKTMIIGPSAIEETVNRYCTNGVFNVAVGTNVHYTRIYTNQQIPFLDVTSEEYWLVDPSITLQSGNSSNEGNGNNVHEPNTDYPNNNENNDGGHGENNNGENGNSREQPSRTTKTFKKVVISGEVPLENYSQSFSSFINTLKNNNLKIEIKFTAKTNGTNPLSENSATIKSVKESASQLGLDFYTEE